MSGGAGDSPKTWFTASELAALALPGLPSARNRMVEFIAGGRWAERFDAAGQALSRPRQGRGGGLEFHHGVLPAPAVRRLQELGILGGFKPALNDNSAAPEARYAEKRYDWTWYEAQSSKVKDEARRRLMAILAVNQARAAGLNQNAAVATVAADRDVSSATLWNWLALIKGLDQGDFLPALAPRRKGGGVKAPIDARVLLTFRSHFCQRSCPSYSKAYFFTRKWAAGQGIAMPLLKTLQREFERTTPKDVIIASRQGMQAALKAVPHQTRTVAGLTPMALINIDGHKFDVYVTPPEGGKPVRPILIAMQDVYSRKMLAWRLCGEESIFHTRLCFADLFEKWGLPEGVLMDNGRAFASKYLTGGTKTRFRYVVHEDDPFGLLPALGIKPQFATPAHGQAKPIERSFGDLVGFIAKHPFCDGAYTGNRPDRKPENYGAKAVEWEAFSLLVDEMISEYNAYQDRDTEMAQGRSFDQVFFERYVRREASDAAIAMALLEAKPHKTDAGSGEIRMFGNRYHAPQLIDIAGEHVVIRFDPDHLHKPLRVYDKQGRLVCQAPVIEAVGFLDAKAAKIHAKTRAEYRRTLRRSIELQDMLSAAHLAAMLPRTPAPEPAPQANIVRPVRARGHSAAAAKLAEGAPRIHRTNALDRYLDASVTTTPKARGLRLVEGGLHRQAAPERT